MQIDPYTDDVICNSMGLFQFVPVGKPNAVRLLLKPSFHPEVCITLEPAVLNAVALRSMLWREPVPCRIPEYSETIAIVNDQFEAVAGAFHQASAENRTKLKWITVDGMSVSALLNNLEQHLTFQGHPTGEIQREFVVRILQLAHASVLSPCLRNRIAECGQYVGCNLAIEPEPELTPPIRIMTLGTPEDCAEFTDILRKRTPEASR